MVKVPLLVMLPLTWPPLRMTVAPELIITLPWMTVPVVLVQTSPGLRVTFPLTVPPKPTGQWLGTGTT